MATSAMTPNASVTGFPPDTAEAPNVKDKINVDVIGPDATPPESKAMAVNNGGQKNINISASA